jgi:hypothetical protein
MVQNFRGKCYGLKMETRSPTGYKQETPTLSDSLAAWGMLVSPSWLRFHRSSSLWLRPDLKHTIKGYPCGSRREVGRDRKHQNRESVGYHRRRLEGVNTARITSGRLLHPPSGVSINTTVNISTSPSPSTARSHHPHCNLLENMMYDAIYSFPMIYCVPMSLFE